MEDISTTHNPSTMLRTETSPQSSGPLKINSNNNLLIESGANISLHFSQRKQWDNLNKISQPESDETEETGNVLYCHLD